MKKEYVYEFVKGKSVRREAKKIKCKVCSKEWLIRKDREHSGYCKRCKIIGEKNHMFGLIPYNKGQNTFNDLEYKKSYYANQRKSNRAKAVGHLGNKCQRCGIENLPLCCWDIHHKDPRGKKANVSQLFAYSWTKVKKELKKCALVCAHCHRMIHHGEERLNDI